MGQDKAGTMQSSTVLTPTVGASYGHGWRQMRKYLLGLFLIEIVGFVISLPSGMGSADPREGAAFGILGILGIIYGILIVNPTEYGISFAYLKAARNDKLEIRDMFEAFRNYRNVVLATLLVSVIILVGSFLLIIPGIIFTCKLTFTPYLIVDRRMGVIEAVKESWRMTNGHAWTVFLIGLLAIPISIVGLLCFVVGIIPALMWIRATYASLYHAVSAPSEV